MIARQGRKASLGFPTATKPLAGVALMCVVLSALPSMGMSNRDISLATSAIILGIGATGIGLMWGATGQVTLAQGAIVGVGAYTAAVIATHNGLSFAVCLPLAILSGAAVSGITSLAAFRTKGHYFIVMTFALGEVGVVFATRLASITGGVNGITVVPGHERLLGLRLSDANQFYILVVLSLTVVLAAVAIAMRSKWASLLHAIRDNSDLAASVGVNVAVHRSIAFVFAGAIGGLAGILYVYDYKYVDPTMFNIQFSINLLLFTLLGGRRYLFGPTLGAALYIFLPEVTGLSPLINQIVFGFILVVMILVLPQGVLSAGSRIRRVVYRRSRSTIAESRHGTAGGQLAPSSAAPFAGVANGDPHADSERSETGP